HTTRRSRAVAPRDARAGRAVAPGHGRPRDTTRPPRAARSGDTRAPRRRPSERSVPRPPDARRGGRGAACRSADRLRRRWVARRDGRVDRRFAARVGKVLDAAERLWSGEARLDAQTWLMFLGLEELRA